MQEGVLDRNDVLFNFECALLGKFNSRIRSNELKKTTRTKGTLETNYSCSGCFIGQPPTGLYSRNVSFSFESQSATVFGLVE